MKKRKFFRKAPHTNQSGFALIMVMSSVLVLEIICLFLNQARGTQAVISSHRGEKLKSWYLAKAGVAHGLWRIQEDPDWRDEMSNPSLGDGEYTVSFTEDPNRPRIFISSQSQVGGIQSSAARTVHWLTIQPQAGGDFVGEDTYIDEDEPDTQYDETNPEELILNPKDGAIKSILVRFNLKKYFLPPDARVISGVFSLYLYLVGQTFTEDIYHLHRIIQPFVDPLNYPIENPRLPLETTWNQRFVGAAWTSPGGDFDSNVEDLRDFTELGWQSWRTTNLIRTWVEEPDQNYGLIIDPIPSAGNKEFFFCSSAYAADPTLAPKLIVYYLDARSP